MPYIYIYIYIYLYRTLSKYLEKFILSESILSGFKCQDSYLTQIEIYEVLRLVRDVTSEITSDDHVPGRVVLFVELFLDEGRDVLFDVVFFQRLCGTVYGVLLHILRHVGVLDDGTSFSGHPGGCVVYYRNVMLQLKWSVLR